MILVPFTKSEPLLASRNVEKVSNEWETSGSWWKWSKS
jgi:hypothetical protein